MYELKKGLMNMQIGLTIVAGIPLNEAGVEANKSIKVNGKNTKGYKGIKRKKTYFTDLY